MTFDLVLLFGLTLRFYYMYLGVYGYLNRLCHSSIATYASLTDPLLMGLNGADHLLILILTLEQLLIFHHPGLYLKLNSAWHTLGALIVCLVVSEAVALSLLTYPFHRLPPASSCPTLLHYPGQDWEGTLVPVGSETYGNLTTDLGLLTGKCERGLPPWPNMCIYFGYSTLVSVALIAASWGLHRSTSAGETEEGVSAVILAEAGLSVAQTVASNLLLSTLHRDKWAALFGLELRDFWLPFMVSMELLAGSLTIFEMISHSLFFLVLSQKYRAAVRGILCPSQVAPELEAHTLHSVNNQRRLPKTAGAQEILELEDVSH